MKKQPEKYLLPLGIAALLLLLVFTLGDVIRSGSARFAGKFFHPYLELDRLASTPVANQSLLSLSRQELAQKIETLQKINRQLALQYARNEHLLQENQKLRQLAKLPVSPAWNCITGEVILRDPYFWNGHFTVNRGAQDGVVPGAAVLDMSPEGKTMLVGAVVSVSDKQAVVQTLFNPDFRVSFQLRGKNAVGFINAGEHHAATGKIPFDCLTMIESDVRGAVVETTGFEQQIPPHILIGTIASATAVDPLFSSELYLSGDLNTSVDFNLLRFVIIAVRQDISGDR